MSGVQWTAIAALTIALAGALFNAGRHAERLKGMEDWRTEVRTQLDEITKALRRLELLTAQRGP